MSLHGCLFKQLFIRSEKEVINNNSQSPARDSSATQNTQIEPWAEKVTFIGGWGGVG